MGDGGARAAVGSAKTLDNGLKTLTMPLAVE